MKLAGVAIFFITMNINQTERILKALANKRRLAILKYLQKSNIANVEAISEQINLSFKGTSKHLRRLEWTRLLISSRHQTDNYYKLKFPLNYLVKTVLSQIDKK